VLFALGTGVVASVALSVLDQLARIATAQRSGPISGAGIAVAIGALVVCFTRGLDRSALWIPALHALSLAATFFTALMTYVYLGARAQGDPLEHAGVAFTGVAVGAAVGAALGTVARAAVPHGTAPHAPLLLRAIGVAFVAGTVVHVLWPTNFLAAVIGKGLPDPRLIAVSLPELLVGPVAGGMYAATRGAGYLGLLLVGIGLALPSAIAQTVLARGQLALDPAARGAVAAAFMLLALRIAAWPLAAAFVQGFLTPSERTPTVSTDL
jgi:hypothetical protein